MSVIADLVALARGRYGPGVPATPKPGADPPAPWLKPSIVAVAQTPSAAGAPATKHMPRSPLETSLDADAAPTLRAPTRTGPPSLPPPGDAARALVPVVPPQPGPAMASAPAPPPRASFADAASTSAAPSRQPARSTSLPEPAPRERPIPDAATSHRPQWPSPPRADEPAAPRERKVAEDEIADRARPRAANSAEVTPAARPSPSRAGPAPEEDRADHQTPAAADAASRRLPVRITIGRIDIQVTGAEPAPSDRARSALSDAARLRRAGVRRL